MFLGQSYFQWSSALPVVFDDSWHWDSDNSDVCHKILKNLEFYPANSLNFQTNHWDII